jgi:hypothetical protein
MKTYREWRYSSTILYFGTRWRCVVNFTPRPLYPRWKSLQYQLDRRLGRPMSRSQRCDEINLLSLPGTEPQFLGRSAQRLSLYRLKYFLVRVHLCTVKLMCTRSVKLVLCKVWASSCGHESWWEVWSNVTESVITFSMSDIIICNLISVFTKIWREKVAQRTRHRHAFSVLTNKL